MVRSRHWRRCVAEPDQLAEDRAWQRLDTWLWHARFRRARSDCGRLVASGMVRINRQPTDKPHARLRPGDVLTLPLPGRGVKVVRILALAQRRGPASAATLLYEEIHEAPGVPTDDQAESAGG